MEVYRFTLDMGLTHAEFFRNLPAAIEMHPYTSSDNTVCIDYEDRHIKIALAPEQRRRIALLNLPFTPVSFEFHNFTDQQRTQFMHRFDLYFRKGGG